MKNRLILSNVMDYKVTDTDCENLVYEVINYDINRVLLGPSSIPTILTMLDKTDIKLGTTIAYPSGAYYADAKASEITELIELYPRIEEFYVVASEGRFLSGEVDEFTKEIELLVKTSGKRKIYIITEIHSLGDRMKEFVDIVKNAGADGILISTGFYPYKESFPNDEDIKNLVAMADGLEVIGIGIEPSEAINTGVDSVVVRKIRNVIDL